jgi:flagellar biosynthesis protein FliP
MTIGTAIVLSVAIICVTFLVACVIGAWLTTAKKNKMTNQISQVITDEFATKLKEHLAQRK